MAGKYAVLVDGGFIKKKLQERHKHFPTVAEIQTEVDRIKAHDLLRAFGLLRVYFYDAPPASGIIIVTGDSDMVPAFKFARREGVRVYLDHMGHGVRRELKAHADVVL